MGSNPAIAAARSGACLSVADATDIIFVLLGLETYLLLTTRRGWTGEKWQQWVTTTLTAALLR